ncbi:hypothetical protein GIB67_007990 [Kingdonia uniflora]|uniref:Uncharacterized protein n=1 Tax=Kingdonia uniflora TaxID=39325 RepID=A0A7J7L4M9_9MAGN|nr:hypothetical protein GIB67_007990 [Kingdonia uniflora]
MELIYQICTNTGMYSSKDELLEKDVELSNTRVPHGEVTILRITLGGYKFMYIHGIGYKSNIKCKNPLLHL